MKKCFDTMVAIPGLLLVLPIMAIIVLLLKFTSPGPVLYFQYRVGKREKLFKVYKFRTMVTNADRMGSSVTTGIDPRITTIGRFLRKTKLDELPQLLNVLKGDMSFVGPRPDVPEIVKNYTPEMRKIFNVKPGITSIASLHLKNEEDILAKAADPDKFYEQVLVPLKVRLAMEHVERSSFWFDFEILVLTVWMLTPLKKIWSVKEHPEVVKLKRELGIL